ncbi:MAG: hypothetical protein H0Z33_08740 [Bacillaceae bacterium]|nr:hypothetical protein [Bacillaceae bacterium]
MFKFRDSRGETLIELLITTFIVVMVLFVLIEVWMSGRAGVEQSWALSKRDEVAVHLMEQLKATPYADLLDWEQQFRQGGQAVDLDPRDSRINLEVPDGYGARFDLLTYKEYPLTSMMKVVIRVREDTESGWLEKASLISNR